MTETFIFGTALRDFLRFRRLWIWLLLGIGGGLIASIWRTESRNLAVVYAQVSEVMVFKVLALASAIFTTAIISQEVEQKTIAYLLTRPIERWRLLVSRYLASVMIVIALGLFGAACVAIGTYGSEWLSSKYFIRDVIAIIFGSFAYGAFFLFVSLVVNRAMIICLLFAFGWETLVPNMPGELYYLSIFSYMKAIAQHEATDMGGPMGILAGAMGLNVITPATGYVILFLITGGLLALSCWWFSTFEYVPREDAE